MPRPTRTIAAGVTYHCFTRCHDKKNFLKTNFGEDIFIDAVQKCQEKYNFELCGFEIVSNHVHLLIKTVEDEATISRIMQYIKARVAEKYNRTKGKSGAFWNGRFGCTIIEEALNPIMYFMWLLWYIAYNTVRKNLCTDPRKSRIGFINCYLTEDYEPPVKITLHPFFLNLGKTFEECVEKLLYWEELYLNRLSAKYAESL